MKEALFYRKHKSKMVECLLCPHYCKLQDGAIGRCKVRKNIGGELYATNYGKCAALAHDPMEKKPLYHFMRGEETLSVGSVGCNLHCSFCQNWQISQVLAPTTTVVPEQIVEAANGRSIAYTFSEPLMWFEFVLDTARLAHINGLKNVLVTNGFINKDPLIELSQYIDAANIDLKGFSNSFYAKLGGNIAPVKQTIEFLQGRCHIELTFLIIPGENDSPEEIYAMVDWIAKIDPFIPLHIARYYPAYKENLPETSFETLHKASEIAKTKLAYVYIKEK